MDIPVKARIPIKELPTVPVLPPVQVLVASAKKKKKDEAVV
jgi:hypothetical protein